MTASIYKFTTVNNTTPRLVSASPAVLRGAVLLCTTDAPYYLKLWWLDGTSAPTVGSTVPDLTIPCPALDPAAGADGAFSPNLGAGVSKGRGRLYVSVTTVAADSDNTAPAAGQGIISLLLDGVTP